ncbi:hypothetical protein GQ42DRAFT_142255 [Ramicandelaber brevisporus]|nr:hypothetical protein GQ42DRAFT_142255 [Ramicandelaber brevisporus]
MQRFPAVPKCPRCNKSVYLAEQVIGPGGAWHKTCLKCASCNKKLDSTNLLDHNDEPYCRSCHTRLFGPKGYGFAGGAAGLSTDASVSASFVALIAARFQPGSTSAPSIYRINQGSTASVGSSPFSRFRTNSNAGGSSSSSSGISNSPARSFFQQQSQQFNDICPRCQKVVYHAEKVSSCGRTWHKHCLKCTDCNKGMTPGNVTDRNGDPYCARCYQKNFGPKGTGFAGGAAYLTAEGSAR